MFELLRCQKTEPDVVNEKERDGIKYIFLNSSLIIKYLVPRSFIEKIHVRGIWGNKLEIVDE